MDSYPSQGNAYIDFVLVCSIHFCTWEKEEDFLLSFYMMLCKVSVECIFWPNVLFFFNWSIIALQCCVGFCHTTMWISHTYIYIQGFPGGSMVKKLPFSAGDVGSIPESKDALETEMATLSSILAWEIPWIRNLVG